MTGTQGTDSYTDNEEQPISNLGVDIPKLTEMIQNEQLFRLREMPRGSRGRVLPTSE